MKTIIKFFVEKTIISNLIMFLLLFLGISSMISIKKELRPEVSMDYVIIRSFYDGASPMEMEQLMVIPIEKALIGIDGIESVDSMIGIGRAITSISIDINFPDKTAAIQNIFRATMSVRDLPEDAEDLVIREVRSRATTVMGLSLHGNVPPAELYKWGRLMQSNIENIAGVSEVTVSGVNMPTIDIVVDPLKLEKNAVSVNEIMHVVSLWNKSLPAGYIKEDDKELLLRIDENYRDLNNVKNLIIRTNDLGKKVSVIDVADVAWGTQKDRVYDRYNGELNAQVQIVKTEEVDTIELAGRLHTFLNEFKRGLPKELSFEIFRDDSVEIKKALYGMNQNIIMGLVLLIISLFLFLNWRVALLNSIGLPFAFFGSIWAMEKLGYTLNSITLIGIILVIGMLVDDSIVIAENIFYHLENITKNKKEAAINGATEMITPVIGTVLTTIAAFLPLVYMTGMAGRFLSLIPIGIIICLIFALIQSIVVLPNHASHLLKIEKSRISDFCNGLLIKIYRPVLEKVIRYRYLVVPGILIPIGIAMIYFISTFNMRLFPTRGVTNFAFNLTGPVSLDIVESDKVARSIEKHLDQYIGTDIKGYRTTVGGFATNRFATKISGANDLGFRVFFPDDFIDSDIDPQIFTEKLRNELLTFIPKDWKLNFDIGVHGPTMGKPIEIQISHYSFEEMAKAAGDIEKHLATFPGVVDIQNNMEAGYFEYLLVIDKAKMATLGIQLDTMQAAVYSAFEGLPASRVKNNDEEYDVLVLYPKSISNDRNSILKLRMPTKYGTYVPLSSFAKLQKQEGIPGIYRVAKKRTLTVSASTTGDVTAYDINQQMEDHIETELADKYPEVNFKFAGEEEQRREMVGDLTKLFSVALIVIYMILCLTFDSAAYPFFALLIIPFGIVGGMMALKAFGEILSFPGMVSFVGLTGIVLNDAILLIDCVKRRYAETNDMNRSLLEGGLRRLRPIFLTTITTVLGLFPAVFEIGGKDANMKPMSIVMAFGLILASIIAVTFIPAFMGCIFDFDKKIKEHRKNHKLSAS